MSQENAGVPGGATQGVALGSRAQWDAQVITADSKQSMNGVACLGFEGLTMGQLVKVWGRDTELARALMVPRRTEVHMREVLLLVAEHRDRALERVGELEAKLREVRRRLLDLQNSAELARQVGAPLERDGAAATAPQGGADTAPSTSPPLVAVTVSLNGSVDRPDELAAMLDALDQFAARRGRAP